MPIHHVPLRKSRPRPRRLGWDTGATVASCLTWRLCRSRASLGLPPREGKRRVSPPRATELAPRGEPAPSHRRPDGGPGAIALGGGASPQLALHIFCCLLRAESAAAACRTTLEALGRLLIS
eukprot:SM000122S25785  [mRNA]  locus=s122:228102:228745:+ [translate_table: standard]